MAANKPDLYDLVITNARVVSVFTGEIFPAELAIQGDQIAGIVSEPGKFAAQARQILDAENRLVVPGFVDAHLHIESSFVTPLNFARLTLPCGTTTVLADPHEIVNVGGKAGLVYMVEASYRPDVHQSIFFGVPSCVPSLPGLETAGAELKADDIAELLDYPGVIGLGEVMDYRAVIGGDQRTHSIIEVARRKGVFLDGHCPGIKGADLSNYMATGIDSDHTKNPVEVALEKARLGMLLQLQEKSIRPELIQALLQLPLFPPLCLVTDDVAPDAIVAHGHLDHVARKAIAAGLPPLLALRAITWQPAQRLRLYDRGIVAPGKHADLVLVDSLEELKPQVVLAGGKLVARAGKYTADWSEIIGSAEQVALEPFKNSVKLGKFSANHFRWQLPAPENANIGEPEKERLTLRAIETNPVDTFTVASQIELPVNDGEILWEGHALLLAIYERYGQGGGHAFVPVLGLSLKNGAVATTYSHDSHNLLTLGSSRSAMALAANAVIANGGGIAVVQDDRITAQLALPIAGLLSLKDGFVVAEEVRAIRQALIALGYEHANPFMSVATLSLPVSPALKLSDKGLIDVLARDFVNSVCC